jgi:hypothetical protein
MPSMIYIPRDEEYVNAAKRLYDRGEISKASYDKIRKKLKSNGDPQVGPESFAC